MTEKELQAIEDSLNKIRVEDGYSLAVSVNIWTLIKAFRAERKATEKLAEQLDYQGGDAPDDYDDWLSWAREEK